VGDMKQGDYSKTFKQALQFGVAPNCETGGLLMLLEYISLVQEII
jgi:hypothetical protein